MSHVSRKHNKRLASAPRVIQVYHATHTCTMCPPSIIVTRTCTTCYTSIPSEQHVHHLTTNSGSVSHETRSSPSNPQCNLVAWYACMTRGARVGHMPPHDALVITCCTCRSLGELTVKSCTYGWLGKLPVTCEALHQLVVTCCTFVYLVCLHYTWCAYGSLLCLYDTWCTYGSLVCLEDTYCTCGSLVMHV